MRMAIFLVVAWSVLFLLHLVVYLVVQRVYGLDLPYQYVAVGAIAALYFEASILTRRFHGPIVRILYTISASWVGILWLLFSATVVYEVLRIALGMDIPVLHTTLLGAALLASIYAFFNAGRLVVKEYTLPLPNLTAPLRVAHLSDIHVGTMHRENFLRRVVTLTNSTKPDVVLITGDLFDGSAPIDEPILRPLNDLSAPTYFSTGNHELYEGIDNVRTTLSHLSLTFLENAVAEFRGVLIVGVNDRQILPRTTGLGDVLTSLNVSPSSTPTIVLYHTPVEWAAARAHGVSLMLSGHTHNGQIFPFNLLVRTFYRYVCGLYKKDGAYLHVSPGTGTWGPPMRLGSHCQVTVLNLVPQKKDGGGR
jgi:predicted MPP superfamily phosphohydrolase